MKRIVFISALFLISCGKKVVTIKPVMAPISESVYASGLVKSLHQYQAFAPVNGILQDILVEEGDTVKKGATILTITNDASKINEENAALSAQFSTLESNQGKIKEAQQALIFAKRKLENDSVLLARQQALWQQSIGSKVDLEQKELAFQNAQTALFSAQVKYDDLKRQLKLNAAQTQKNWQLASKLVGDFTLRSEIDGIVYQLPKQKGEIVSPQTVLAIIGDATNFILEMQVDENDILKITKGMKVLITMDSYKGKVFEAKITKVYPLMNERSKSFVVEASFIQSPEKLFPNVSFEANILLNTKEKALLIPREYVVNDSFVMKKNGEKIRINTGLKDYKMVEILSGISAEDELMKPSK